MLYNNNMALGLSYLSLCVQKSGCFYPQRRMLLAMSGLNQNNKSLSRLAIISEHVAADKRKRFWSRLGWFLPRRIFFLHPRLFFWYLFISPKYNPPPPPLFLHVVGLFPQELCGLRVTVVVLGSGCLGANGGCSAGLDWWALMSLTLMIDAYCTWQVMRPLWLRRWALIDRGCPNWLILRCVWECMGVALWFRNSSVWMLSCSRQPRVKRDSFRWSCQCHFDDKYFLYYFNLNFQQSVIQSQLFDVFVF